MKSRYLILLAVGIMWSSGFVRPVWAEIIGNGTLTAGFDPPGNFIYDYNERGLMLNATGNDPLIPGSPWEGWGIRNLAGTVYGYAHNLGTYNITVESYTSTPTSFTSVVNVGGVYRVRHRYDFSLLPPGFANILPTQVTVTNLSSSTIPATIYRRVIDWDIPPTTFYEFVQIGHGPFSPVSSFDGFESPDPTVPFDFLYGSGPGTAGPDDLGSSFDLTLPPLDPGESFTFYIFWGADLGGPSNLLPDLQGAAAGPITYALSWDSSATTVNTFGVAFSQTITPEPSSVLLLGISLGFFALRRRRYRLSR